MPLKYYGPAANLQYWSEHWASQNIASLLEWAKTSPLTRLLALHLPREGKILEGGCGLEQFVLYLRTLGYDIEGIDYSEAAIRACQEFDPSAPVRLGDVRRIDAPSGTYQAYISLGVVEHFEEGPDEILQEARRVLSPDGIVILSVPFVNGVRFLFKLIIECIQQNRCRDSRHAFYQFAYSKGEITDFLRRNGFEPAAFHPYDPGRLIKQGLQLAGSYSRRKTDMESRSVPSYCSGLPATDSAFKRFLRKFLYFSPILWAFAHMMLVIATRKI